MKDSLCIEEFWCHRSPPVLPQFFFFFNQSLFKGIFSAHKSCWVLTALKIESHPHRWWQRRCGLVFRAQEQESEDPRSVLIFITSDLEPSSVLLRLSSPGRILPRLVRTS